MRQNALPLVASTVHYCQFSCTCASDAEVRQNCCCSLSGCILSVFQASSFSCRGDSFGVGFGGEQHSVRWQTWAKFKRRVAPATFQSIRQEQRENMGRQFSTEVVTERHASEKEECQLVSDHTRPEERCKRGTVQRQSFKLKVFVRFINGQALPRLGLAVVACRQLWKEKFEGKQKVESCKFDFGSSFSAGWIPRVFKLLPTESLSKAGRESDAKRSNAHALLAVTEHAYNAIGESSMAGKSSSTLLSCSHCILSAVKRKVRREARGERRLPLSEQSLMSFELLWQWSILND